MDDQVGEIENHFHDLLTTMKRRNRHIVPLGNGGVQIIDLPNLHKQTGLYLSCRIYLLRCVNL